MININNIIKNTLKDYLEYEYSDFELFDGARSIKTNTKISHDIGDSMCVFLGSLKQSPIYKTDFSEISEHTVDYSEYELDILNLPCSISTKYFIVDDSDNIYAPLVEIGANLIGMNVSIKIKRVNKL